MNEIISTTQSIKDQKNIEKTGVTALGALGSFLVGTATGGIGIAAAGFVLKENLEGYEDNADEIQDVAEQRQTFVSGIYKAKQCTKPLIEEESIVNVRAEKLISIEPASGQKNDRTSFLNN